MNKVIDSLNANEILELIFIYLTEVSSLRDYDQTIKLLANMGRALTNADRCSIWIVSDDKKTIWTKYAHGIECLTVPIGSGIVGSAIANGEKIIIDDVYKDKRFNIDIDQQTKYKTKSMLVVPMYDNDNNIIGAFQAINRKGKDGRFDKKDIERLMLASTYAAETLRSIKLESEITDTQKEVIFTMGAIGESRSRETGNHVKRVSEYSKILALAYGLSPKEAEILKQVSPMHDIGKVAIPDNILNKPGPFTEKEREIMNQHAELGYQMINNSSRSLLKSASIVAYEHHEKWDGTGYPRGLKGEEIHIYGRITALADVFDALGSDRVYKKAWDDEKIFQYLREERGKHFDPKVVDIFFENLDQILTIRNMFRDEYAECKEVEEKDGCNKIKILGAHGTRGKDHGTTSFLLNKTTAIDAGNLLNSLEEESTEIELLFLTHSHLDHIVDIAYIVDNYFNLRQKTLKIVALKETVEVIQKNFLNDSIWPDFSKIYMSNGLPVIEYEVIEVGKEYKISKNETLRAFKTDHTVPSCGYVYTKNSEAVLITGDTLSLSGMFDELDKDKQIKSVVIECSFPNELEKLAIESKHLTSKLLFTQLNKLKKGELRLYINHIKPSFKEKIIEEIAKYRAKWQPIILNDEDFVYF
jgi:HD-GYP domain-containing protein (c-di-GMP phosphodiesterase class II)/ribonuclease BN (tRNA processing enzyme)